MSTPLTPDELDRLLERKRQLAALEERDPELARRLQALRAWQSARLARTYEDLRRDPRYGAAATFFLSDLYGPEGSRARDQCVIRAWSRLKHTLPQAVLRVLREALELDVLTAQLDQALAGHLGGSALTDLTYAAAYRAAGQADVRARQIDLIVGIGAALERAVQLPLVGLALQAAHLPAHLAGFGVLQDFLERGHAAFRAMRGATLFLQIIRARETLIMHKLFAGAIEPFAGNRGGESHPAGTREA